jgi:hypothetical protein
MIYKDFERGRVDSLNEQNDEIRLLDLEYRLCVGRIFIVTQSRPFWISSFCIDNFWQSIS